MIRPIWYCFNVYLIWSVHVVDFYKVCDPGWVRSFRGMWSWPLMAVHFVDLYNFMNWLGPSIMCIGVLNVGRVRPLFWSYISLTLVGSVHFLDLYKFAPGWVRPLCGPCWPLVGSIHFVVIILVARTQHGLECSFIRFKAVEKSTYPLGLKKVLKK